MTLHVGDCREVMAGMPDASVDAVVTDPPYGLEFMGKEWDSFKGESWRAGAGMSKPGIGERPTAWPAFGGADSANATCAVCGGRMRGARKCCCDQPDWRVKGKPLSDRNACAEQMRAYQAWCAEWAVECLRVLKPGAYLLAFGGTRTYHRLTCAIEDAGFQVRDSLHWIYGSGFPKGKACLKPAHEPIVLAWKPAKRIVPLAIDACRIDAGGEPVQSQRANRTANFTTATTDTYRPREYTTQGRWPPNVLLGEDAATELDRQSGTLTSGKMHPTHTTAGVNGRPGAYGKDAAGGFTTMETYGDTGGASRFFPVFRYQAKASSKERPRLPDGTTHPTVKPLALMQWLVRLVTPPGGLVLDPFCGTGTTLQAAALEGFHAIGIDSDPASAEFITCRLSQGTLTEATA